MAVTNDEEFRVWLRAQSSEAWAGIAYRAALRVLPLATRTSGYKDAERLALSTFRATLASGLVAATPEVDPKHPTRVRTAAAANKAFARASHSEVRYIDVSAAQDAAAKSSYVAVGRADAAHTTYQTVNATVAATGAQGADDAAYEDTSIPVRRLVVTPIKMPDDLEAVIARAFASDEYALTLGQDPKSPWAFWRKWYDRAFAGDPLPFDLQESIACIPNDDWEKGPEHIARLIEEIEARFLADKLPQAEEIEFNADTGLFRTVPRPPEKPDLLAATLVQVADALDDALANPSNGLSERSRETRVIRRTLTRYGNDPQQIEMSMVSAHRSLTRQIVADELPPSEENIALQEATAACARGLRAAHPEIAENRRILDAQALAEVSTEDKAKLEDALPVLEAISEPDLASEWVEDIPAIVSEGTGLQRALAPAERNPILAAYDEKVRVFSRVGKIGMILRRFPDVVHRLHDGAGHKLVVLGMSGTALTGFIIYLVRLGIGLL